MSEERRWGGAGKQDNMGWFLVAQLLLKSNLFSLVIVFLKFVIGQLRG